MDVKRQNVSRIKMCHADTVLYRAHRKIEETVYCPLMKATRASNILQNKLNLRARVNDDQTKK